MLFSSFPFFIPTPLISPAPLLISCSASDILSFFPLNFIFSLHYPLYLLYLLSPRRSARPSVFPASDGIGWGRITSYYFSGPLSLVAKLSHQSEHSVINSCMMLSALVLSFASATFSELQAASFDSFDSGLIENRREDTARRDGTRQELSTV